MKLLQLCPEKPVLLIVSPKTKPIDLWLSGTAIRIPTMTSTPTMCHQAENALSIAVAETLNMFTRPARSRIIP